MATKQEREIKFAHNKGREEGLNLAMMIFLYVLLDKFGFSNEQINKCARYANSVSDDIIKGKLKWTDIRNVLRDEYDYEVKK